MKKYSKIGLFKSKGRIFKESLSKYRTPFQRDRDRIIHSASFRRLKHKTQVFVNTEGDHYQNKNNSFYGGSSNSKINSTLSKFK